jgi:hypothetical protein
MKLAATIDRGAWRRLAAGLAVLGVLGCRDLDAPPRNQVGALTVSVVDQTNKGVGASTVTLEVGEPPNPNKTVRATNDQGLVAFDLVPGGQTTILFAEPPAGYTGGGRSNAKSVQVVVGENVAVTLTLTKTAPAPSR